MQNRTINKRYEAARHRDTAAPRIAWHAFDTGLLEPIENGAQHLRAGRVGEDPDPAVSPELVKIEFAHPGRLGIENLRSRPPRIGRKQPESAVWPNGSWTCSRHWPSVSMIVARPSPQHRQIGAERDPQRFMRRFATACRVSNSKIRWSQFLLLPSGSVPSEAIPGAAPRKRTLSSADRARYRHSNCCDGDPFGEIALRIRCAWPTPPMRLFTSTKKIISIVCQQHRIRWTQFRKGSTLADSPWIASCCHAESRSSPFWQCARSEACAQGVLAYSALCYRYRNANFFAER